jgi:hypothetical protein
VTGNNIVPLWVVGIEIRIKPDIDTRGLEAARGLAEALRLEGLEILGPKESKDLIPPVASPVDGTVNPNIPLRSSSAKGSETERVWAF